MAPLAGHVPLFVDRGKSNEVLGLLSVGLRTNGRGYSGDDLKGLVELGNKIGLALNAIRMAEKREGINRAPVMDPEPIQP
jgi:GAF domain-containing protein